MTTHASLANLFEDTADAVRERTNVRGDIVADSLPTAIRTAPALEILDEGVSFLDYDGTVVCTWTPEETANKTSLPPCPDHTRDVWHGSPCGLNADGWNWSLSGIKEYMRLYPEAYIIVAALYEPIGCILRIKKEFTAEHKSPTLCFGVNGTVTIAWGDGQETTATGSNVNTMQYFTHEYAAKGYYCIEIRGSGTIGASSAIIVKSQSATANENRPYNGFTEEVNVGVRVSSFVISGNVGKCSLSLQSSIKKINAQTKFVILLNDAELTWFGGNSNTYTREIVSYAENNKYMAADFVWMRNARLRWITIPVCTGATSELGYSWAFGTDLRKAIFPDGYTIIGSTTYTNQPIFDGCTELVKIRLPNTLEVIGCMFASNCTRLPEIEFPETLTKIGNQAFSGDYNLKKIVFRSQTPPTVTNSNAWTSIPSDCVIHVPVGTLDNYKTAANYPDPSVYTYIDDVVS